jgi:hypothetical protein
MEAKLTVWFRLLHLHIEYLSVHLRSSSELVTNLDMSASVLSQELQTSLLSLESQMIPRRTFVQKPRHVGVCTLLSILTLVYPKSGCQMLQLAAE